MAEKEKQEICVHCHHPIWKGRSCSRRGEVSYSHQTEMGLNDELVCGVNDCGCNNPEPARMRVKNKEAWVAQRIFKELEKEGYMDKTYKEPCLKIGYHAYRQLKSKWRGNWRRKGYSCEERRKKKNEKSNSRVRTKRGVKP